MKTFRTLRLRTHRLGELTPVELDRVVAAEGTVTTPSACVECITERVTTALGVPVPATIYRCR